MLPGFQKLGKPGFNRRGIGFIAPGDGFHVAFPDAAAMLHQRIVKPPLRDAQQHVLHPPAIILRHVPRHLRHLSGGCGDLPVKLPQQSPAALLAPELLLRHREGDLRRGGADAVVDEQRALHRVGEALRQGLAQLPAQAPAQPCMQIVGVYPLPEQSRAGHRRIKLRQRRCSPVPDREQSAQRPVFGGVGREGLHVVQLRPHRHHIIKAHALIQRKQVVLLGVGEMSPQLIADPAVIPAAQYDIPGQKRQFILKMLEHIFPDHHPLAKGGNKLVGAQDMLHEDIADGLPGLDTGAAELAVAHVPGLVKSHVEVTSREEGCHLGDIAIEEGVSFLK